MDVPGPLLGRVEGIGAKDLAVGGDDEGVVARDLVGYLRYAYGLAQRKLQGAREPRHGRRHLFAASAPAGVGLGDDEAHVVVGGSEPAQDGGGQVGCASEGYVQGTP